MGNLSPFDVAKDLSTTKKRLITEDNEKEYVPFLINRFFSNFYDTVRIVTGKQIGRASCRERV